MKLISTFLALSLSVAFTTSAFADRDGRGRDARGGDPVERIMGRFDLNRDGVLDRAEVAQMRQASAQKRQARNQERRQRQFARALQRFDTNRDGRLGSQEVPAELARKLTRFDHNGDGWVDASEVTQPPTRGSSAQPAPQPRPY
jgi:Ca2+-binding EF-hand superfamily protein